MNRSKKRGLVFYEKKRIISKALVLEMLSLLFYTAIAIVIARLLVFGFGYRMVMSGASMTPTIENGETLFIDRVIYRVTAPKRGDIVAFYPNGNTGLGLMVKRVVALPGETVRIENGTLFINDIPASDPDRIYDSMIDGGIAETPLTVPSGEVFVLGDRRNASEDSRSADIGTVAYDQILGKVWANRRGGLLF